MRLKEKVAIVTGAGRGIGAAISKMFAEEGAAVALASRNKQELEATSSAIKAAGGTSFVYDLDVRDHQAVKKMVDDVYRRCGKIDILVNNAGLPVFKYAIDDPSPKAEELYEDIININLNGYWYCMRYVTPYLKENGKGSIINISSVRGRDGIGNESAYCMAKGGVNMLTRSMSVELAPYNIRVNAISPGAIQVDLGHWVLSRYGQEAHETYVRKFKDIHLEGMRLNQPLRVIGEPDDIAYATVYLSSDEAKFVTGANLLIDGGLTAVLAEPPSFDLGAFSEYHQRSEELREWFSQFE